MHGLIPFQTPSYITSEIKHETYSSHKVMRQRKWMLLNKTPIPVTQSVITAAITMKNILLLHNETVRHSFWISSDFEVNTKAFARKEKTAATSYNYV
jgi:hypothetical protein